VDQATRSPVAGKSDTTDSRLHQDFGSCPRASATVYLRSRRQQSPSLDSLGVATNVTSCAGSSVAETGGSCSSGNHSSAEGSYRSS
ncbi:unnamed protein product, partial [Amoebophrya sp. A25]